ncbi:MAG: 16S rRNA (guanine(966)-N(2))-methyltransferase RsmD [bacterium]|jgi:16S rRNA (guanine966-N2)-methyltransferase
MKIIGGKFKGRAIEAPRGLLSRPPLAIIRESVFNIMGQDMEGKTVLDLFSGSGSLGIEAISRGASRVHFVDASPRSVKMIRRNAEVLGITGASVIVRDDAAGFVQAWNGGGFDIVFIDPPFLSGKAGPVLSAMQTSSAVSGGSTVVLRLHRREALDMPSVFRVFKERRFGENLILFIMREQRA